MRSLSESRADLRDEEAQGCDGIGTETVRIWDREAQGCDGIGTETVRM